TEYPAQSFARLPVLLSLMLPLPPRSTLFPYTTLFRSSGQECPARGMQEFFQKTVACLAHLRRQARVVARADQRGGVVERAQQTRSEEHTSELQSRSDLVCRLLLEKKKKKIKITGT